MPLTSRLTPRQEYLLSKIISQISPKINSFETILSKDIPSQLQMVHLENLDSSDIIEGSSNQILYMLIKADSEQRTEIIARLENEFTNNKPQAIQKIIEIFSQDNLESEKMLTIIEQIKNRVEAIDEKMLEVDQKIPEADKESEHNTPAKQIMVAINKENEDYVKILSSAYNKLPEDCRKKVADKIKIKKVPLSAIAKQHDEDNGFLHKLFSIEDFLLPFKKALQRGADLNFPDKYGRTILELAVKGDNLKIVKAFLEEGVDPDCTGAYGITPLQSAVIYNRLEIVKALLEGGAEPERTVEYAKTLLELAVERGNLKIVKALLEGGAEPDRTVEYAKTLLELAVEGGKPEIVKALLEGGAEPDRTGEYAKTLLELAVEKGKPEITNMLKEYISKLETQDHKVNAFLGSGTVVDYYDTGSDGDIATRSNQGGQRSKYIKNMPLTNNKQFEKLSDVILNLSDSENSSVLEVLLNPILDVLKKLDQSTQQTMITKLQSISKNTTEEILKTIIDILPKKTLIGIILQIKKHVETTDQEIFQEILVDKIPSAVQMRCRIASDKCILPAYLNISQEMPDVVYKAMRSIHTKCSNAVELLSVIYSKMLSFPNINIINKITIYGVPLPSIQDWHLQNKLLLSSPNVYMHSNADNIPKIKIALEKSLECGAPLDTRNLQGQTALHLAVYYDLKDIVEMFLKHDCVNLDIQDNSGLTPLALAKFFNNRPMVELLQESANNDNQHSGTVADYYNTGSDDDIAMRSNQGGQLVIYNEQNVISHTSRHNSQKSDNLLTWNVENIQAGNDNTHLVIYNADYNIDIMQRSAALAMIADPMTKMFGEISTLLGYNQEQTNSNISLLYATMKLGSFALAYSSGLVATTTTATYLTLTLVDVTAKAVSLGHVPEIVEDSFEYLGLKQYANSISTAASFATYYTLDPTPINFWSIANKFTMLYVTNLANDYLTIDYQFTGQYTLGFGVAAIYQYFYAGEKPITHHIAETTIGANVFSMIIRQILGKMIFNHDNKTSEVDNSEVIGDNVANPHDEL